MPAKPPKLRAVDKNGRFILGYASHVARVRPGVDLTAPTCTLTSEILALRAELAALKGLSPAGSATPSVPMPTLTKTKKPTRKAAAKKSAAPSPFPGLVRDPLTGLYVKPLAPGQKPISRKVLAAALADAL